jgi:hypothetical protein
LSDKEDAYVGASEDGPDLWADAPGGGIGTIVRPTDNNGKETGEYIGGEVHSSPAGIVGVDAMAGLQHVAYPCSNCTLLVVYCRFKNISAVTHTFNPLQAELAEKASPLVAVGSEGSYVFAKNAASWEKLRKLPAINTGGKFPSGETWKFGYIFAVSKGTSVWKLMYHGIQIAEIKPEQK